MKTSCIHCKAVDGAPKGAGLSEEAWKRELDEFLGEDGNRRRTCISSAHIPEDIHKSERFDDYMSMQLPLLYFLQVVTVHPLCFVNVEQMSCLPAGLRKSKPSVFYASSTSKECPRCHVNCEEKKSHAKLFCILEVEDITIVDYVCPSQCGYAQRLDGGEYCMLRKQTTRSAALGHYEAVFTWELLYYMRDQIETGVFYYSILKQLMKFYERSQWREIQLCGLQSLYSILKEAFMDFIDLMKLPLNHRWCTCEGDHLIADGVTVATRRGSMNFNGDWYPKVQLQGQPQVKALFGSKHQDRFAVTDKTVRTLLRPLTSTEGCHYAQVNELREVCKECHGGMKHLFGDNFPSPAIQSFLDELETGSWRVPKWSRGFLREISAESPALAILPVKDIPLLQHWNACVLQRLRMMPETVQAWDREDDAALKQSLPCLWECLTTVHDKASNREENMLCDAFASLVQELIEVCKATLSPSCQLSLA